ARPALRTFAELAAAPAAAALPAGAPGDLAYVIYTSGSTGVPKGAMVEQRGMVNHLFAKITDLAIHAGDCVAQNASQCFDISVWQFLSALVVGGRTHIIADDAAHDPVALLDTVHAQGVTVLEVVPSMLRAMLEELEPRPRPAGALRWLMSTGEALPPELARRWLRARPDVPLVNAYGPTECSDDVTHHILRTPPTDAAGQLPIGTPIANTQIYVLDAQRQLVPEGFLGELYVGGVGVGRGYLHRPDLTERAFVPDPFTAVAGARMYRTGDLGRHLPGGAIEFLGRIDHQVKVRGFRIELGDLETALERQPGVKAAAAVAAPDARGELQLVAYVVSDVEPAALRRALGDVLPAYMVPQVIVPLAEMPLNANGKLDRKALPPPPSEPDAGVRTIQAPRTPLEAQLAQTWRAVLGVEQLGVDDDFFALGGHSLLATRLVARLRDALGRDVPLRLVFEAPTIAAMASALDGAAVASADPRADLALVDDLAIATDAAPAVARQVLLTGATGFFGAWLLRALIDDSAARVVCVVRAESDAAAHTRLAEHLGAIGLWDDRLAARVAAVAGDLARPRLGWDDRRWAAMASELDAVIHNGAWVNFALPYARLRDANVLGTRELLRLAATARKKPFHFVSTLDVQPPREGATHGDVTALATGYAQSKWVGEALVQAAARRGLPVSIFRAGLLVGDAIEGRWTSDDFAKRLLLATLRLGAAPEVDLALDLTPVDFASRALVRLAGAGATGVFHLANPRPIAWRALVDWMAGYGFAIDRLAPDAWLARLVGRGDIDPVFAAVIGMLNGGSLGAPVPAPATEAALAAAGLCCPAVDQALVARYLDRFIREGLLLRPGAPGSGPG
ncbi:MAG TPA: amino acid adenylation domain-containing protein, partial [Kofleriaceae bacterium]|nr:amino acid adenylation domain-containing protein [Kofleriaceae bacterium]